MQGKNSVIITSNRDEHAGRANAAAPAFYFNNDKKIVFPKDAKAGGTWFVAGENGVVAVLLNGAFKAHMARPPYRKSRGLILLEIVEADNPYSFFKQMNLHKIEPFTIILYQYGSLQELRWDGNLKYEKELNSTKNYIWSSATLYTDEIIALRENLFDRFIQSGKNITEALVQEFHADNNNDYENGFIINRQTGMKTFSITQAVIKKKQIKFLHHDLIIQKVFEKNLLINQSATQL